MNTRRRGATAFGWIMYVAGVCIVAFLVWGAREYQSRHFRIVDGVVYDIISVKPEVVIDDYGQKIPACRLRIADGAGRERETIVPKGAVSEDETLPPNVIVWDEPLYLRGRTYNLVRCNPEGISLSLSSSDT